MRHATLFSLVLAALASLVAPDTRAGCPLSPPIPGGANWVVTSNGPGLAAGTLRWALTNANPGDAVRFSPAMCGQTFTLGAGAPLPPIGAGAITIIGCAAGAEPVIRGTHLTVAPGLALVSNANYVCGLHFDDFPATGLLLQGSLNHVDGNVFTRIRGPAIRVTGQANALRRNLLKGLSGCGISLAPGANGGALPPTVTASGAGFVQGTVIELVAPPALAQAVRPVPGIIDVFWGPSPDSPAAVLLGQVAVPAGAALWNLAVAPPGGGVLTATFTEGGAGLPVTSALGESCDGADQDCDGVADDAFDFDIDGSATCAGDCDDNDPAVEGLDQDGDSETTCAGDCDDLDMLVTASDFDGDGATTCDMIPDCNDAIPAFNWLDSDADGYFTCGLPPDCDDGDAALNWDDDDGDGVATCYEDCDDNNPLDQIDGDGDGWLPCFGDCDDIDPALNLDDADSDGFTTCGAVPDCDDLSRFRSPADPDGDGFDTCGALATYDCDDVDGANADADRDNDGTLCIFDCDESDAAKSCADADGDDYATCPGCVGKQPALDCDDNFYDSGVAPEICNGLDDDCDGVTDEGFDFDGDGDPDVSACGSDCDDHEPRTNGAALERCNNGVDDDCDGVTDELGADADGDGRHLCVGVGVAPDGDDDAGTLAEPPTPADLDRDGATVAGGDCDDTDPSKNLQDYDGDGATTCGTAPDCDDSHPLTIACGVARAPYTHVVTVDAAGSFSPQWVWIHAGDTVAWQMAAPPAGTVATDAVASVDWVGDGPELCTSFRPAAPQPFDDLTGPEPYLASGVFTLGPDGPGYLEETVDPLGSTGACAHIVGNTQLVNDAGDVRHLCPVGADNATMESTWENPQLAGVFIRLRWNQVHLAPGVFDFTALDREVDAAVRHGKLYSLAFKAGSGGTPDWIFSSTLGLGTCNQVQLLHFEDSADDGGCVPMDLGSPMDPSYRCHYFALLEAVAEHLRSRGAWYRALAYFKLAGANLFSHEARLPKTCDCDGCGVCNSEVWATATLADGITPNPYTPAGLYAFFEAQAALLKTLLPGKPLSYQLIQDGFPEVAGAATFETCFGDPTCTGTCAGTFASDGSPVPGGVVQTETILEQGRTTASGDQAPDWHRWVVQHNGIRPMPSLPNHWVTDEGEAGQPTGWQTTNGHDLATPAELESTLQNALERTSGVFFEIYEQRAWEVRELDSAQVVDPAASGKTLGQWAWDLHVRRVAQSTAEPWAWNVPAPYPGLHQHTFVGPAPTGSPRYHHLVHASKCRRPVGPVPFGVVAVLP